MPSLAGDRADTKKPDVAAPVAAENNPGLPNDLAGNRLPMCVGSTTSSKETGPARDRPETETEVSGHDKPCDDMKGPVFEKLDADITEPGQSTERREAEGPK